MDAVDILQVCFRRWYVMLPILIGAAGVSHQLMQSQETTYTAAASYGLVQPGLAPGAGNEQEANPLGQGGGALVGAALEAQLNSRETQAELGSEDTRGWGPGDVANHRSYDVQIPQFETTYEVRAWGEDENEVRAVVNRVLEAAPDIADEAQVRAGVAPPQRYTPFVLAPTQVEALPATSGMKLVIAVMGVGLLMGAAWSIVADRALRWRRAQKRASEQTGRTTGPSAPITRAATQARDDRARDHGTDENARSARMGVDASTQAGVTGTADGRLGGANAGRAAPSEVGTTSGSGGGTNQGHVARARSRPGGSPGVPKLGTTPANRR